MPRKSRDEERRMSQAEWQEYQEQNFREDFAARVADPYASQRQADADRARAGTPTSINCAVCGSDAHPTKEHGSA